MVARRVHTSSTPVRGVNLYQCPALPPGHRPSDGTRRYTVKSERVIRGISLFALFPQRNRCSGSLLSYLVTDTDTESHANFAQN